MYTSRTARRVAILAAVGLLVFVSPLLAQGGQRNPCGDWSGSERARHCEVREQTLPVVGGGLTVDATPNGGVTVRGWDRQEIQLEAKVETTADTDQQARALAAQVRVLTDGGRIRAEGPRPGDGSGWSVSFDVMVPTSSDLDLRSTNGGIRIMEVRGRLSFQTTNGGITLEKVNGDVRGSTSNGGLHITLDGAGWDGEGLDVETHNGGVRLALPDGYSAHLETGTVNGGFRTDFPITVQGRTGRTISTDLGNGGPPIRVRTTNGGVSIERR